jgi:translation elongation factor EF-4
MQQKTAAGRETRMGKRGERIEEKKYILKKKDEGKKKMKKKKKVNPAPQTVARGVLRCSNGEKQKSNNLIT